MAGLTGDPAITAVKVYNPSTHDDARALAVTGTGDITVQLANTVDEADKQALNVMGNTHLQSYTGENAAHKTLEVVNNSTHADARGLKVEGKSEIEDMIIDSTNLNANGYLKLGTQSPTTSVKVGNLNNELSLAGDPIYMEGHVLAGESIDANGDGPTDLAIGTDASTQDLKLSQDGQIVDIMGDARLNENEFVVNDAANLAAGTGCGFKYNSGGHPGPNMPCIDFYVGGNVVGWIDADGWTNAP
ncbi:MAG: hypothetical protein P9X24_15725 [Candidatus Hatepunaea meridiana]|nr:hypothetical protein [Candidatus Hatepunaea meridiana]